MQYTEIYLSLILKLATNSVYSPPLNSFFGKWAVSSEGRIYFINVEPIFAFHYNCRRYSYSLEEDFIKSPCYNHCTFIYVWLTQNQSMLECPC